ncbi:peptidylprolyl isomerase [Cytophagales bacterium LB-30]|uniref:Peptidyl-prolyl cis-trans isomerase n=1 Tax=Shiella aurantiaca TaxID=3058365 RepID=A0ABT8F962_9BACT|nr:peptidylprolyl isomerase [Shiella aurantiaca]MDN4166736.1 peptidylprolyl isomerase [Shiella aurantiaca]
MRKIYLSLLFGAFLLVMAGCGDKEKIMVINTPYGSMKALLYEETPLHKANFLKLVENGSYDSTLFHRVIEGFMIQGGDVNAKKGVQEKITYTIPAEFVPQFFHKKGALAAARMGDDVNPKKESSGCQFYIVQGKIFTEEDLKQQINNTREYGVQDQFRKLLGMPEYLELRKQIIAWQESNNGDSIMAKIEEMKPLMAEKFGPVRNLSFNDTQKQVYAEVGGAPHLDGEYTVFGQVVEGLAVIDSIAAVQKNPMDKPLTDLYITVEIEEISKKEVTKKYGYVYPEVKK